MSALLLWACRGGEPGEAPGGDLGTRTQPIAAEQPGGIAEAVWRWYDDPDLAKSSYASPTWFQGGGGSNTCSTSMIGPNLMMGAAHCGNTPTITLSFLTYAEDNNTAKRFEDFTCQFLYSTWHSSDLLVFYCPPNGAGVSPGDKYGYLDFDTSPLSVGSPLYSIWGNPLGTGSLPDVRFLSKGTVTSTTGTGTFTTDPALVQVNPSTGLPDYKTSVERPIAINTNLWSNGGASGSGQLSATTHKLAVGPLSTGAGDAPGRNALSIAQYLLDGTVDSRDPASIQSVNITALGLTPATYGGLLDKNGDKLFDLQTDLERLRGENSRTWYSLAFDSERRNALWTLGTGPGVAVTFNTTDQTAHIVKTWVGPSLHPILTHQRLNLAPGTYRLSVQLDTVSADFQDVLWFGIRWVDPVTSVSHAQGKLLWSTPGAGWEMHALEVTLPAGASGAELMMGSDARIDTRVAAVNVVKKDAVMNMDTADLRLHWRNDINGARGRVVPRGVNSGTVTDWALRVKYDASSPLGYPIRNRQLAMVGANRYRICFKHRQETSGMGGAIRVTSSGEERAWRTFSPGASWTSECTVSFRPKTDDNNVQFGVRSGTGSYLVDDITVEDQPRFTVEPGIDRPGSDIRFFDTPVADPVVCEDACANENGCLSYTYVAPGIQGVQARCYLKNAVPTSYAFSGCHSGYRLP